MPEKKRASFFGWLSLKGNPGPKKVETTWRNPVGNRESGKTDFGVFSFAPLGLWGQTTPHGHTPPVGLIQRCFGVTCKTHLELLMLGYVHLEYASWPMDMSLSQRTETGLREITAYVIQQKKQLPKD